MTVTALPLSLFVNNLERGIPFSAVRYGDGEFQAVLGGFDQNCDGVQYTDALAAALTETLTDPREYLYCLGPKTQTTEDGLNLKVQEFLAERCPGLVWFSSETLLDASVAGELFPFVRALQGRRVLLVGQKFLTKLPPTFRPTIHIQVPPTTAFEKLDTIETIVRNNMDTCDVILCAAGPCSKILIHRLYPDLGKTHTLLDIGSVFDMAAGVFSRRYAKRLRDEPARLQALIHQNFYGN